MPSPPTESCCCASTTAPVLSAVKVARGRFQNTTPYQTDVLSSTCLWNLLLSVPSSPVLSPYANETLMDWQLFRIAGQILVENSPVSGFHKLLVSHHKHCPLVLLGEMFI